MSNRERAKHYGHGRWERGQLYAIVISYYRQERNSQWVSKKLGITERLVQQIFEYAYESDRLDELAAQLRQAAAEDLGNAVAARTGAVGSTGGRTDGRASGREATEPTARPPAPRAS